MKRCFLLSCGALALSFAAPPAGVPYPAGYRNWAHVKSMVISEGHPLFDSFGGIHHIYANPKAMQGYKTGKWPDGAIIVFDLLEARPDGAATTEGARKAAGVMHRDASRYKETGGWGYEAFKGDSPTDRAAGANAATACHACHVARKDHGFVYSSLRK